MGTHGGIMEVAPSTMDNACKKMGTKGTTLEFFKLKQPHGANKYSQYTAVYS